MPLFKHYFGLQTKLIVTIVLVAIVPLCLVSIQSFRVIKRIDTQIQLDADKVTKVLIQNSESTIDELALRMIEQRAQHVMDRLESHYATVPEGEIIVEKDNPLLRNLAIDVIGSQGYTMVFNMQGYVIFHPLSRWEGKTLDDFTDRDQKFGELVRGSYQSSTKGGYLLSRHGTGGFDPWLMACEPGKEINLVVCATASKYDVVYPIDRMVQTTFKGFVKMMQEALANVHRNLTRGYLLFLIVVLATILIISGRLASNVVRPLNELTRAVRGLGAGDARQVVGISQRNEIGELARAFVKMKRDVKLYQEQVTEKQRELELANREIRSLNQDLEKRIKDRTYELEEALQELKSLDKNKDDFIALVSHELRTPLTSVRACTEGLLNIDVASTWLEKKHLLTIIQEESDRLTRLIDDVLQIQRLEAGRMPMDFIKINLVNVVQKSVINMRPAANRKKIQIDLELSDDQRLRTVRADYDRIMQVLINLLSNAIKFTPDGGTIKAGVVANQVASNQEKTTQALVSIIDSGPGVPPKEASRVFDKFYQAERIDYHSEGSGLGLPIAKYIIDEHGGKIWYEPGPDGGAAFYFLLPIMET